VFHCWWKFIQWFISKPTEALKNTEEKRETFWSTLSAFFVALKALFKKSMSFTDEIF